MNRLHALIRRLRPAKARAVNTRDLPQLSAADLKLVAGGLPNVGGFGVFAPPPADPKATA